MISGSGTDIESGNLITLLQDTEKQRLPSDIDLNIVGQIQKNEELVISQSVVTEFAHRTQLKNFNSLKCRYIELILITYRLIGIGKNTANSKKKNKERALTSRNQLSPVEIKQKNKNNFDQKS